MKKRILKIISLFAVFSVLLCTCSCSLTAYSEEELRSFLPKAVANSYEADLFYWKETVNRNGINSFRKCNVFAELNEKTYEPLRNDNGDYSNLDVEIQEQSKSKNTLSILCGNSSSSKGGEPKDYLFTTAYDSAGKETEKTKTPLTAKEYVGSADFQEKYSLRAMLAELEHLTVDDMDFNYDKSDLQHKGKVITADFKIKDSYLERYKVEHGTDSIFAGSSSVSMEFAYDKVSSVLIYENENLDNRFSMEKEAYKLEIVYFGPIVSIPKYDEAVNGGEIWTEV